MLREPEPGVGQHLEHRVVLDQHLRLDPAHAAVTGQGEEVLQQQRAETLAVVGVGDQEGNLHGVDGVAGVAVDRLGRRKAHEPPIDLGHQRQRLRMRQHVLHVAVGGRPRHVEEAHPQRILGDLVVKGKQGGPVGGGHAPDDAQLAVGQHHVGRSRQRQLRQTRSGCPGDGRSRHAPMMGRASRAAAGSLVPRAHRPRAPAHRLRGER